MGDVRVKIAADTSGLKTGLASARSDVDSFASQAGASLKGFGASLTGALSIGALMNFGRSILDLAGEIQDMSDRTNVGVEKLQSLGVFFEQAGAKSGDLSNGLVALNNKMEEAKDGSIPAITAFEKLGVTWQDIQTKSPDEVLAMFAKRMEESKTPAADLAALSEILGSKIAGKLAPGLKAGAAAMDDFNKSFKGLSKEDVKTLDDAGDAVTRLTNKVKVLGGQALLGKAPAWLKEISPLAKLLGVGRDIKDMVSPEAKPSAEPENFGPPMPEAIAPDPRVIAAQKKADEEKAKTDKEKARTDKDLADAEQKRIEDQAEAEFREHESWLKRQDEKKKLVEDLAEKQADLAEAVTRKEKEETEKRLAAAEKEIDRKLRDQEDKLADLMNPEAARARKKTDKRERDVLRAEATREAEREKNAAKNRRNMGDDRVKLDTKGASDRFLREGGNENKGDQDIAKIRQVVEKLENKLAVI